MSETIRGLEEFESKLSSLALDIQRKYLMDATKAGAEPIRQEASQEAPRLTGHLSDREIVVGVPSQSNAYEATVRIGPAMDAFYGVFDEKGTAHMVAQPFLEPAAENKYEEAVQRVADVLRGRVEQT